MRSPSTATGASPSSSKAGVPVECWPSSGAVALVECKAGRTVTPSMAVPMQRLAVALESKRAKAAGTTMFLVHQSPLAGSPTPAVAPGVRALPWQEFLETL